MDAFEATATAAGLALTQNATATLAGLRSVLAELQNDDSAFAAARTWVVQHLPKLIYIEDYPEGEGHQNLSAFLLHQLEGTLSPAENNFAKLMKVAELDPQELQDLLTKDHEERQQLTNRASALVSATIRRLWTDRQLTIRFNVDAEHLDTLVADPNAVYPTEINLNERSRGFKWFFSFYVTFAADTMGGPAEKALLLFDEPGLHLHATAQRDLLRQFETEFANQILYTTHSPFTIPVDNISSVRTVNIAADVGTTVTNDPTGDSKTLFPLQAALGFEIAQTLFVGPANLIVEGVTDFWYISAISEYLRDAHRISLPTNVAITPAGGSAKVTYLVSLLSSQNLQVVVLLDDEPNAQQQAREIARSKLLRDDYILFASSAFDQPPEGGCDIEDLFDAGVFRLLVEESYAAALAGKELKLNPGIPRSVKRYEDAFSRVGLEFNKTRPAKVFLRRMAEDPDATLTPECTARFERLFIGINASFEAISRRTPGPFR